MKAREFMDEVEILRRARWIMYRKGVLWDEELTIHNIFKFAEWTVDCLRYLYSQTERSKIPWLENWAILFHEVLCDFERIVERDPLVLYLPRTKKHEGFHKSKAYLRYLIAGNGTGKTLAAYVEDIWCATGQMHWSALRGNVAIVSTGHSVYSEKTFLTKMIHGEDGDPFSPYLPPGGKWLHSYDERKFILRIACPDCANAGRTLKCTHLKKIQCLSADSGVTRMMGFTVRLYHIDEHVNEDIANELHQRARRGGANGRGLLTATPLAGPNSWEIQNLYNLEKERPEKNWLDPHLKTVRYTEVFEISKYDCVGTPNGPTLGEIEGDRQKMPASEFKARVMGQPVPLADNPAFDISILDELEATHAAEPKYYKLEPKQLIDYHERSPALVTVEQLRYTEDVKYEVLAAPEKPLEWTGLRLWELPQKGQQYAIGADTALGVGASAEKNEKKDKRDASAAPIYKLTSIPGGGIFLDLVGLFWGYLDVYEYAKVLKLMGYFYNKAVIIPETNGVGGTLTQNLTSQMNYPGVYVGDNDDKATNKDESKRYGVDTNPTTKPKIVAAAHSYVKERAIIIRDKFTISEFRSFQQTPLPAGGFRYEAAQGSHDDTVVGTGLVCYACRQTPIVVLSLSMPAAPKALPESTHPYVVQKLTRNKVKHRYI